MPTTSGFFLTAVSGYLRPSAQIVQWNIAAPNPSGLRHVESGAIKRTANLDNRGGFTAQMESGVAIDYGNIFIQDGSGFETDTVALTLNFGQVNENELSRFDRMWNNGSGTAATNLVGFNFRFWVGELNAFDNAVNSGTSTVSVRPSFYFRESAEWRRNYALTLTEASGGVPGNPQVPVSGVFVLPSSMPDFPNIYSRERDISISGAFVDREFTNFIYTRAFFPQLPSGQNYRLGTYGGLGEKTFRLKFSYDYTAFDANIRNPWDLQDTAVFVPNELPDSNLLAGLSGHWQLNEDAPDTTRISRASGFPGQDMTIISNLETGASAVDRIEGIVSSGTASGWAMLLNPSRDQYVYTDTQAPNTLIFDGARGDGIVSFTFTGWIAPNDPSGLDPNIGVGVGGRIPRVETGVLSSWNNGGADNSQQYRCYYRPDINRFQWQMVGTRFYLTKMFYHDLNVDNADNGFNGGLQPNKWYFLCFGYDKDAGTHGGGELFFRVNDGPIDRFPMSSDTGGTQPYDTTPGAPFCIGGSQLRTDGSAGNLMGGAGAYDSFTLYRGVALNNDQMLQIYNKGLGLEYPFPEKKNIDFSLPAEQALPILTNNPTPKPLRVGMINAFSFNDASGVTTAASDLRYFDLDFKNPLGIDLDPVASGFHQASGLVGTSRIATSGALSLRSHTSFPHPDGQPAESGWWSAGTGSAMRMEGYHDYTIAVWWRPIRNATSAIIGKWEDTANRKHWRLRQTGFNFGFTIANNVTTNSELTAGTSLNPNFTLNRWYFIVVQRSQVNQTLTMRVFDSVTKEVYVGQQSSVTLQPQVTDIPNEFAVGAYNTDDSSNIVYANGDIDWYGLWRRELTTAEIEDLFNDGQGREFSSF